jgi:hypothetical protein
LEEYLAAVYQRKWGGELTREKEAINQLIGKFLCSLYNFVLLQGISVFEIRETRENMREILIIGGTLLRYRCYCGEKISEDIVSAMVRNGMVIH